MSKIILNVQEAVENFLKGDAGKYRVLCAVLKSLSIPEEDLHGIICGLKSIIGLLTLETKELVSIVLAIKHEKLSDKVAREISQFSVSLAVGQVAFTEVVLRSLIKKFMPFGIVPTDRQTLQEIDDKLKDESCKVYNMTHRTLKAILKIHPMCEARLITVIGENYPFFRRHVIQLRDYVRNVIRLMDYTPNLRTELFRILISETLRLDTACAKTTDDIGKLDRSKSINDLTMDCDDEKSILIAQSNDQLVDKLDVILNELFTYIQMQKKTKSEITTMYRMLLEIFERIILPVYNCNQIQYLWIYMCSLHQDLAHHFMNFLWCKVMNPGVVETLRLSAVCYLASFLARANFVSLRQSVSYLTIWVEWLQMYASKCESTNDMIKNENLAKHVIFYALSQATFYVIVCRHREILDAPKGHKLLKNLRLDKLITCQLNPLKYCNEIVLNSFASISRTYQFAFCYSILERNRRYALYEIVNNGKSNNSSQSNSATSSSSINNYSNQCAANTDRRLHFWLPFELFHLCLCKKFVENLCSQKTELFPIFQSLNVGLVSKSVNQTPAMDFEFLQPEDDVTLSKSLEKFCSMARLENSNMMVL